MALKNGVEVVDETVDPTEEEIEAEVKPKVSKTVADSSAKELAQLKKALANLQKERDEKAKEHEDFKAALAREKLSETEKVAADLADFKSRMTAAEARAELLAAERQKDLDSFELYSRHGLADPELGPLILKRREDGESLTDLVARVKSLVPKIYWKPEQEEVEEEVEVPRLHGGVGSKRQEAELTTMSDQKRAESMFPRDAKKQEMFLKRLKESKAADKSRK